MRVRVILAGVAVAALGSLYACSGEQATLPLAAGEGPSPTLPNPVSTLLPTMKIAPVQRWADGAAPTPAPGLRVSALAQGLDHPRWLYVLPNDDVLVAETNGPDYPGDHTGIKGAVSELIMSRAGAKVTSANRITLLRTSPDGSVQRTIFLQGLTSPFGMLLVGHDFYVADTDALLRFPYQGGETQITAAPVRVTDLPGGPIDHHWTKNVIASPDGVHLFVSVGSNSNVAENGIAAEDGRAAIWEVDPKTGAHRVYAGGMRNPVGMGIEPATHALWTSVNERDELGSDLVPDYMTSVKDGAFYGWPWSYYGQHVDTRVSPQQPDMVAKAIPPDYALGNHTASLGFTFSHPGILPAAYQDGAFIGQHGSWNRNPPSGYKVVFVAFKDGRPAGLPTDVLTGFLAPDGNAHGRPVGVTLDRQGALLVADDVGNTVWRVTAAP